ncbi:hypothetical protein MG293_018092 [Ovis ammon polii]|uniref:Uncharacterized protein n=1 Tax=Ovis ammon polii TaxID=230172 RepID=A0AAD4TPK6_OVIAM|nr:hypothetical protein MG293_018092 [Ovis ammon polii]
MLISLTCNWHGGQFALQFIGSCQIIVERQYLVELVSSMVGILESSGKSLKTNGHEMQVSIRLTVLFASIFGLGSFQTHRSVKSLFHSNSKREMVSDSPVSRELHGEKDGYSFSHDLAKSHPHILLFPLALSDDLCSVLSFNKLIEWKCTVGESSNPSTA